MDERLVEITIWYGNEHGEGAQTFLVDTGSSPSKYGFDTEWHAKSIQRAVEEFRRYGKDCCISRIDVRRLMVHRVSME